MTNIPDVSIAMMTYFHEKYVSQAIESVLKQKTRFSYEIIISDDGSTDKTRDILEDYARRYPNIIRLNFNENNRGISQNNYLTRCLCKGRYIATLSGDDYWIDEGKIEKQITFLEEHKEYYSSVTNVEARFDEDNVPFSVLPSKKFRDKKITLDMFLHGAQICTHGLVMRNSYLTKKGREYFSLVPKASRFIDDTTECLLILNMNPVFSMDFNSTAYRVQRNKKGKHNYNSNKTVLIHVERMISLYNYIDSHFEKQLDLFYLYKANVGKGIAFSLSRLSFKDFLKIYHMIPNRYRKRCLFFRSIPYAFSFLLQSLFRKLKK